MWQDPGNIFSSLAPVIQFGRYGAVLTLETLGQRWNWEKTKVWRFLQKYKDVFTLYRLPGSYGCLIFNRLYPSGAEVSVPSQANVVRIIEKIRILGANKHILGTDHERLNKLVAWFSQKALDAGAEQAESDVCAGCEEGRVALSAPIIRAYLSQKNCKNCEYDCRVRVYAVICVLTVWIMAEMTGTLRTMFIAFLGLFHKVYACGMLAGIVLSTTKVNEFLSAMNRVHAPKKLVIPLAVMLRYIPTIQEDWRYIKDAMRMRDVSPSLGGFLSHPGMTVECIYVPLMMTASKAADELSIASVTRGIENPNPRTCLVQIKCGIADWMIMAVAVAFLIFELCVRGGVIG